MTDATDKKQRVEGMFDAIAPTYDALNHLLSLGIDKAWRRRMARIVAGGTPREILDVATGTGDLAIAVARAVPGSRITGIDISANMLAAGREKVARRGLEQRVALQAGDGEALGFPDRSFDCVTVAFGVRNFGDIAAGLREMQRVLRPGGRCFVLEFSEPRASFFGRVYNLYFHRVLPWLGRLVSGDAGAYAYLPRSVDGFPSPESFAGMLRGAGFSAVRTKKLTFGVAYIYEAEK